MKLNFRSIQIENFFSIGTAELELQDNGYVFVRGINENDTDNALSNGSGKSSIWEAISWCLCGETIRGGCKDVVNQNRDGGAMVKLVFNADDKEYIIIRSKEHKELKTNLKIFIDGEDKSGKGIRDSEKLLAEYLPDLTSSLIGSVIILGQGMPKRFSNNTPSGRKEVLEKLSKSDFMIQDLKIRISARKLVLDSEIRQLEDSLLTLSTTKQLGESSLEKETTKLEEFSQPISYDDLIEEYAVEIERLNEQLNEESTIYTQSLQKIETINESIQKLADDKEIAIKTVKDRHEPILQELSHNLIAAEVNHKTAEANLKQLERITDICPTCKQKLPDVHKPDTTAAVKEVEDTLEWYNKVLVNKNIEQEEYQDQIDEVNTYYITEESKLRDILTLNQNLSKAAQNELLKVKEHLTECGSKQQLLITQRDNYHKNLEEIKNNIETLKNELNQIEQSMATQTSKLNASKQHLEIINKFNTIVARDFRGYLLLNIIEYINNKAKEYSKEIFLTDKIDFSLSGNNLSISYDNKGYEALSGGEKQKVDLIVQFAIRDMMCTFLNFSSNILVVDEIFDNLDKNGCEQVINLITNKLRDIGSVYIISHHTDIDIPYDKEMIITKGKDGVSYIK